MVRWQLFATLTFKSVNISDRVRESMYMAFIRKIENAARVLPHRLLWCRRAERGEIAGRLHFHSLIGGLPSKRVHPGTCFQFMRYWEHCGGGHARVRVFASDLQSPEAALGYTLKGLDGSDLYESGKFNSRRSTLTLSRSVARVVATAGSMRDRNLHTDAKCVSVVTATGSQAKTNPLPLAQLCAVDRGS